MRHSAVAALGTLLLALAACGRDSAGDAPAPPDDAQVVHVYNWYDYIDPQALRAFEAQTGIHVRYDLFDSNNSLEAKLLAGRSGYDVVFPSAAYLQRMTRAGVFRKLDKSQLRNLPNLDSGIMRRLAEYDPGNEHAVVYTWGITGFAYDAGKIRARLPDAPLDSWSMLFDPKIAAKLADCGIGLYESPYVIFPSVLAWLGEDPNSEDPRALDRAAQALKAVRPYIRKVTEGSLVEDLATGELCLVIASNGDAMQIAERARAAGREVQIGFSTPREGAVMWFDVAAIPADAPHPRNAERFIDFLLDAKIAAANSNVTGFPNGNAASQPLLKPELRNAQVFPDAERAARLFPELPKSEDYVRLRTRAWTRFKTGQ
jgi:putrescine transport system substrate-binding protein